MYVHIVHGARAGLLRRSLRLAILAPRACVCVSVLAGAAQSTDLMQSYKTGHLLHASPRAQFVASISGCVVGVWGSVAGVALLAMGAHLVPWVCLLARARALSAPLLLINERPPR